MNKDDEERFLIAVAIAVSVLIPVVYLLLGLAGLLISGAIR